MRWRAAPILALLASVLASLGVILGIVGARRGLAFPPGRDSMLSLEVIAAVVAFEFAAVGLLLARRRTDNPIGWIFLVSGVLFGLVGCVYGYADLSLYGGESWPLDTWAAWLANWLFEVPTYLAPCVIAQLFPTGRAVSNRWRWVLIATCVTGMAAILVTAFRDVALDPYPGLSNPAGVGGTAGDVLDGLWSANELVVAPALLLVSASSLVVRFRRATGVERLQLKWMAYSVTILLVSFTASVVAGTGVVGAAGFLLGVAALLLMPVAIAIAILRYRLYEIDRIISRTLVYGAVTVVLGAAYAGLVLAGQTGFASIAGGSNLAIAVSTLVVAGLFLPLRARVQRVVDRRFNRRHYDAQLTLDAFAARLREQVDLDELAAELRRVVTETMQPMHVSLWRREVGS